MRDRLAQLYEQHAPAAKRFAFVLVGDESIADDLVQEAFARVAGRWHDLRHPDRFGGYLHRTILNLARGRARRLKTERAKLASFPVPSAPSSNLETRELLWRHLLALPARQRAAIFLRYYEDYSEQRAAETLDCSSSALKSLVRRGMQQLRAAIPEEDRWT